MGAGDFTACAVTECGRQAKRNCDGLRVCGMHGHRFDRHGTFEATRAWGAPNPEKAVCAVEGCEALEDGRSGLCKLHGTRRRRHGDPTTVIAHRDRDLPRGEAHHRWTGDQATYLGAHQRVRAQRGRAKDQRCVDCGNQAAHWSYNRACPNEIQSELGPYSIDVEQYVPRCVSCHKRFDLEAIA